ncbi:MAG: rhamnosyltransferase subunit [Betaproteobacteria bacterium]|nr:rhamnosyltransferase subunit [Betaproteobacteria bacterium]
MKRIVFATFGSLGDLHPYLAIALELKRRGHRPLIVTTDVHRAAVESEDIEFAPMRPNVEDMGDPAELVRKLFHPTQGPEYLIRDLVMPHVRAAYEDLDRACVGADMLVTHPLTFAGRLVAEKRRLAWRSSVLSPLSLMSEIDPPLLGPAPWLLWVRRLGIAPYRAVFRMIKRSVGSWEKPLHELRADLGLPPMRSSAQFEGQYAPRGNLALFSGVLAAPQADWPPGTTICGFSRYDGTPVDPALRLELDDWLSAGPAPVVFTLGSSVSMYATDFFGMAIDAAGRIGRRALLITGQDPTQYDTQIASAGLAPGTIKVFRYLPYSGVFPRAAVTVHQAGIGTLAQALAAGKPQLIVPVGFDQPDNARRAVRLGVARSIPFQKLAAAMMARALRDLLASPAPAATARTIARIVEAEEQEQRAAALLAA